MTWIKPPCWRSCELPAGRTWESFRFEVQDLHAGWPVDELVTDELPEMLRLMRGALDQGYDVRVIERRTA